MAEKPIYCGSGKKQNNKWLKVTINPDKIMDHIQTYEGNKLVKLNINIKEEPDRFGKDVSITIDTWKKDDKKLGGGKSKEEFTPPEDDSNSPLPF